MCKSFLKKYLYLFIVLVLVAACEGQSCIEADDFGEYDTDVITVNSKTQACDWIDRDDGYDELDGDEAVFNCLSRTKTSPNNFFDIPNTKSCRLTAQSSSASLSCLGIKECLLSSSNDCAGSSFNYTGIFETTTDKNGKEVKQECKDLSNANKKVLLENIYSIKCLDVCISECSAAISFEPSWTKNNLKEKGGFTGIEITSANKIQVQAVGSIILRGGNSSDVIFSVNTPKLQPTNTNDFFFLTKGIPFSLSGNWCRNGPANNTCPDQNKVGEFLPAGDAGGEANEVRRSDFLRRGVLFLNTLPTNGYLDGEGKYVGPLMKPDFNAWKCSFNASNDGSYSCENSFTSADYEAENISLYGMENAFVKTVGGLAIPSNVMQYITENTLGGIEADLSCSTVLEGGSNVRKCQTCVGQSCATVASGSIKDYSVTLQAAGSGTKNLSKTYLLNKNGINVSQIYPSKVAFKIVGSSTNTTDKCTVNVETSNVLKSVKVNVDGGWHFLVEDEGSANRVVLNKNNFNTMNLVSTNSKYLSLADENFYDINITFGNRETNANETWQDETGKEVPCGEGMLVMFFPQNEVLIEKSGFVSFKNMLAPSLTSCSSVGADSNSYRLCNINVGGTHQLSFSIINPLYNFKSSTSVFLGQNFYEYGSSDIKTANVSASLSPDWSSETFVRRGQILRFNENSWFAIETNPTSVSGDNNSFVIREKVLKYVLPNSSDTITKNVGEGLFLRIDERPALLCLDSAEEEFNNADCNFTINSAGQKSCTISYTDVCMEKGERYCPYGCFPESATSTYFVESGNSGVTCVIAWDRRSDYGDMSVDKCDKCRQYISTNSGKINPTITKSVTQCYDLEEYAGAVSLLTKSISGTYESGYKSETGGVKMYGNLTENDVILGAKKLQSVFETGSYGTLDGMDLDDNRNASGKYAEFTYSTADSLQFNTPRQLGFITIDNSDFNFGTGSYNNNNGNYRLTFTPQDIVNNGAQLAVFLGLKDWKPSDGYAGGNFKKWIVKYNTVQDSSYGILDNGSPYEFDSNGILVNKTTRAMGIDMAENKVDIAEDDYTNLRLFFKIIDREEKVACTDSTGTSTFKVSDTETDASGNSKHVCRNLYFNNSGSYTIQLKTPRDFSDDSSASGYASKATGYIVQYVMEPIMNLLDGKTIGVAVDNNSKPIPCGSNDTTYRYGGDLGKWRVGTACSKTDPSVGKYCKTATFTAPSGTCSTCITGQQCDPDCDGGRMDGPRVNGNVFYKDNNALLPGAREQKWGNSCDPANLDDPSVPAEDYPNYCFSVLNDRCVIYKTQDEIAMSDNTFGTKCMYGDKDCFQSCSTLSVDTYGTHCRFVNDGKGFVQKFYKAAISDSSYQVILRICFILMVSFYGMYYLLGMAELTHGELIRRVIKIGFIYLMVGKDGWYYYNEFFVRFFKGGVDYLVFAIAGAFDDSSSLSSAFVKNDFYDKSVLFSGVDKNLALVFSDQVTYKIWGLMFVSFFGWLYVFLIYSAIITYILAVANALLLYLTAQFFISMLLAFGPVFFVLLVFEKTKEMFSKWINNLISFSLEQIFLLTCLSLFNMLVYNIIKFVLSYRVCWRPVWVLNIPLLGNVELMSFWKATSSSSPMAAASVVPGLFQILLIYLIANLMKNFIEFSTNLGASLGGGGLISTDLSGAIKSAGGKFWDNNIAKPIKEGANRVGTMISKKTLGYKTEKEEKEEEKSNKVVRDGIKTANKDANRAVENYRKTHGKELLDMPTKEREDVLRKQRTEAFTTSVNNNPALMKELNAKKIKPEDLAKSSASKFTTSDSLVGLVANKSWFGTGKHRSSDAITKGVKGGFSDSEVEGATKHSRDQQLEGLKGERQAGGLSRGDYADRRSEINAQHRKDAPAMVQKESDLRAYEAAKKRATAEASSYLETSAGKAEVAGERKQLQDSFRAEHPDFDPANKPAMFTDARREWNAQNSEYQALDRQAQETVRSGREKENLENVRNPLAKPSAEASAAAPSEMVERETPSAQAAEAVPASEPVPATETVVTSEAAPAPALEEPASIAPEVQGNQASTVAEVAEQPAPPPAPAAASEAGSAPAE